MISRERSVAGNSPVVLPTLEHEDNGQVFVLNHNAQSTSTNAGGAHVVWLTEPRASDHVASHGHREHREAQLRGEG